ncbi:MAG: phosphate-starvation-inducible PsiE family protein [Desulfurococcales archaeon]|nr:phosphate-starvation-inducible PsiE family protein [Desulfurococcales archaeon]
MNNQGTQERSFLDKILRGIVASIELIIAGLLIITLLIAGIKTLDYLSIFFYYKGFDKQMFLEILDVILLSILALDLLRTLVVAVIKRTLPISIVIEVALLAVLREIIAIEIRNPTNARILVYGVIIIILVFSWISIQWFRVKIEGVRVNA